MKFHPDYEWLEQYAAGSLSLGPALCVAVHVSLCIECRQQVAAMQSVGGALLGAIGDTPVGDDMLQVILDKIDAEPRSEPAPAIAVAGDSDVHADRDIPGPLRQWVSRGYDRLPWSRALPSLRIAALDVGDEQYQVALHRIGPGGSAIAESARRRLLLWDVDEEQIRAIAASGAPAEEVELKAHTGGVVTEKLVVNGMRVMPGEELYAIADLSRVWITASVYEYELPLVKKGQEATVTLSYQPGVVLRGRIAYIYPYLDVETRTLLEE